ncbi:amino acid ABC transporter substrate-binding protein [Azospirillum canadense]|uniref:amino acid ABC transporter substrate-binding protein n=1 Tax=Azospirillum canadense TaxID=403962 RepID=UPI002227A2A5|nr:amino acid ABC transporter substrate-binding protein [Azospirillum canadense]MCW2242819.1 general L-amino acid transport system substrate-binding protein [Azospirillum canadense]
MLPPFPPGTLKWTNYGGRSPWPPFSYVGALSAKGTADGFRASRRSWRSSLRFHTLPGEAILTPSANTSRKAKVMWLARSLAAVLLGVLLTAGTSARSDTLEHVRDIGILRCGLTSSGVGLSAIDSTGQWQGFYTDMCRALAAAVTGNADHVEFIETDSANRVAVLRRGEVDVVMGANTWTLQRDTTLGVSFPVVYLYDGQSFMAHRSLGVASLSDLAKRAGAPPLSVCVGEQTTSIHNLEAWIARTGAQLVVRRTLTATGGTFPFFTHQCDLITNDQIWLHGKRLYGASDSQKYVIFPETFSKEPLGPMVRSDDRRWFDIVRWVFLVTVLAEEKGITATNAQDMRTSEDMDVRKLLGVNSGLGQGLGLGDAWGWRVVTQVGNYGEIYERHLGQGSPLRIERGLNAQWTQGGLMYAPPLGE